MPDLFETFLGAQNVSKVTSICNQQSFIYMLPVKFPPFTPLDDYLTILIYLSHFMYLYLLLFVLIIFKGSVIFSHIFQISHILKTVFGMEYDSVLNHKFT